MEELPRRESIRGGRVAVVEELPRRESSREGRIATEGELQLRLSCSGGRVAAEGELQRRERRPVFLICGDLAIVCRSQNMCWFSESTGVL